MESNGFVPLGEVVTDCFGCGGVGPEAPTFPTYGFDAPAAEPEAGGGGAFGNGFLDAALAGTAACVEAVEGTGSIVARGVDRSAAAAETGGGGATDSRAGATAAAHSERGTKGFPLKAMGGAARVSRVFALPESPFEGSCEAGNDDDAAADDA